MLTLQIVNSESEGLSTEDFAEWWRATGERELRQLLYWRWDPIGVADHFPNAADEYDHYAPQIVSTLRAGGSDDELTDLLGRFEQEDMGLSARENAQGLQKVAELLRLWFENSQHSWQEFGPMTH